MMWLRWTRAKRLWIEPLLDVADGELAEILIVAVEDVGVVGVGVNRHDALDGELDGGAVVEHRQPSGGFLAGSLRQRLHRDREHRLLDRRRSARGRGHRNSRLCDIGIPSAGHLAVRDENQKE